MVISMARRLDGQGIREEFDVASLYVLSLFDTKEPFI